MNLLRLTILAYLAIHVTADRGNNHHSSQHSRLALGGRTSIIERDGVKHTIFDHKATGSKLDFVTNSGICETTPGVNQYSGYFSVGSKFNIPISLG